MKTIGKLLYTALCGTLLLTMASCDDDDYKPGEEPAENNMGVYFSSNNESEFIKADGDEQSIQVLLCREVTDEAASVPIEVVAKTDNIDVPATVDFEAGEAEAWLTINYTDMNTIPTCSLRVASSYTNPYKMKEGTSNFNASIYKLKLISDRVTYKPYSSTTDTKMFTKVVSEIYQYEGVNKFVWRNFMGSGIELKFRLENGNFDAENIRNCYGDVVPLEHYYNEYEEDSGELLGWYLMNEVDGNTEEATYATWTPEGSEDKVENYLFFYYDGYMTLYFDDYGGDYGYGILWSLVWDVPGNYHNYYVFINY